MSGARNAYTAAGFLAGMGFILLFNDRGVGWWMVGASAVLYGAGIWLEKR